MQIESRKRYADIVYLKTDVINHQLVTTNILQGNKLHYIRHSICKLFR